MKQEALLKRVRQQSAPVILDVRSSFEFRSGHISGAIHAPLLKIIFRLARLPKNKDELIVLTCEHGPRAQIVKGVLSGKGYRNLEMLDGHMSSWKRSGLPLEK